MRTTPVDVKNIEGEYYVSLDDLRDQLLVNYNADELPASVTPQMLEGLSRIIQYLEAVHNWYRLITADWDQHEFPVDWED